MPATLRDLDEYFSPGLTLTVRGKEYVVPLPNAELGLWCQRVAQAAGAVNTASSQQEIQAAVERVNALPELDGDLTLAQRVLGHTYDQMVTDQLPYPYIEHCGQAAYVWIIAGEDAAEQWWQAGGRPEALRPGNRAQRRAAGGTATAAAPGTRSRASTSGTKSRKTSPGNVTAKRSPGKRSSPTGR